MENVISKDKYFLIIDNKENRKLCIPNVKTIKLGKREFNVEFFIGKELNTFWALDKIGSQSGKIYKFSIDCYSQISHKDFFGESMSYII